MRPARFRALLGVDDGADAGAIRRAYADRLRALDVDADPQGFADLRRARDMALAHARGEVDDDRYADDPDADDRDGDDPDADDPDGDDFGWEGTPSQDAPWTETSMVPPPAERVVVEPMPRDRPVDRSREDLAAAAIWALLLSDDDDTPLDDDRCAALHDHVDALLASPRLEELDFRTEAETWFADLIHHAGRRADPILDRVVAFFGWAQTRGRLDQPWTITAALDRYDQRHFLTDIVKPGNRHRTAWNVLSGGQSGLRNLFVRGKRVRELLAIIRRDHPDLEPMLDHERVAQWEHGGIGKWRTIFFAIWFAIMAVRLFTLGDDPKPTPNPLTRPFELRTFEQDIGPLMKAIGGPTLTLAALRRENRAYHAALERRWRDGKQVRSDPAGFFKGVADDLVGRYAAGLRVADLDTVRRARRLELDQLILARDRLGTLACLDLSVGRAMPQLIESHFTARRQRLVADVVLRMGDVAPVARPTRFTIPGRTLKSAATRAGMTIPAFGTALDRKGDSANVCAAWIALYQSALAQPGASSEKLLRAM